MIEGKCARCGKTVIYRQGARVMDLRGKERVVRDTRIRGGGEDFGEKLPDKIYCIDHLPPRKPT